MNRIVIIHSGAIGDLIQVLPALHALRRAHPGARITLVGRRERAALAILAGAADESRDLDGAGLWRFAHDPSSSLPPAIAGADLVLDFLGYAAAGLARHTPPPQAVTLTPLPPPGWDRPAAEWIGRQVAEQLGVAVAGAPEIRVPAGALAAGRELVASRGIGGPFAAIHPGSGSPGKNWPIDRFATIARRLGDVSRYQVVWLAGPAEIERGTYQTRNSVGGTRNAGAENSILQDLPLDRAAAVLALADAYLGNDSGITQVAAAVRRPDGRATPTAALFGPTDPRVWAPRGSHVKLICSRDGSMDAIAVDEVWAAMATWAGPAQT